MSTSSLQSTGNSPFQSILEWSANWPLWQSDALRRIILNGELKADDLDELEEVCKSQHGLTTAIATPLSKENIPAGPDASSSVSLIRLSALKNVNRVRDGATMEFGGTPGLTIAFGDNGTGKSSYARVIKRACRARGNVAPIRPNVFDPQASPPATAQIVCAVGTVETPVTWKDGTASDPRLSNIFVFDTASARLHVSEDGPATFIPRGLDVLPKLAKACDELRSRFKDISESASQAIAQLHQGWKCRPHTKAASFAFGITENTSVNEIVEQSTFTEEHRKRLIELADALRSDPRKKSQATIASATRIQSFAELITAQSAALGQKSLADLAELTQRLKGADAAAAAAAGPQFDERYLTGTGGEAWRELWEIARQFSTQAAYPDRAYPVASSDARCVLCQQTLDADAQQRFKDFESFVRSESRVRADEARRQLANYAQQFGSWLPLKPKYEAIAADLAGESPDLLVRIESFVASADALGKHIHHVLRTKAWADHPGLTESPEPDLRRVIQALKKRADMELSADDPDKRKALGIERDELEDREWLSKAKADVISVTNYKKVVAVMKKCQNDTTTNAITIKSGELHETFVTKAFCDRFSVEVGLLGLQTLPVKLESVKGAKGERRFGIRLEAPNGAAVHDVASEGEQRCIALAAFLAELSQASHRSALVFDDPVSSLDHANRKRVAKRLCDEAKVRQVIIFSHDSVFLGELLEITEREAIPCECLFLSWDGGRPGRCEKGLPHDWQRYTERLDALSKDAAQMKREWNPVPNPQNVAHMREAYGRFRATVEKVVQDVIFNGVVVRYRSYINVSPRMLEPVVGFDQSECNELLRLHKTACDCTDAHDPAAGKHAAVPTPTEFKADLDSLKSLVEKIKARRKAAGHN